MLMQIILPKITMERQLLIQIWLKYQSKGVTVQMHFQLTLHFKAIKILMNSQKQLLWTAENKLLQQSSKIHMAQCLILRSAVLIETLEEESSLRLPSKISSFWDDCSKKHQITTSWSGRRQRLSEKSYSETSANTTILLINRQSLVRCPTVPRRALVLTAPLLFSLKLLLLPWNRIQLLLLNKRRRVWVRYRQLEWHLWVHSTKSEDMLALS